MRRLRADLDTLSLLPAEGAAMVRRALAAGPPSRDLLDIAATWLGLYYQELDDLLDRRPPGADAGWVQELAEALDIICDSTTRWFAIVDPPVADDIRRVELHAGEDIYLFLYRTADRSGQCFDQWHCTEDDARAVAAEVYGVDPAGWAPLLEGD